MTTLAKRISAAIDGTKQPTGLDLLGVVAYGWIMLLMAFMDLIMFAVDAFGFIGYALFSLFGPLMIPLYMTKHFSGKFWGWVDGLIVFGMYRAVSAAITFIWANLLIGFFDNTIGADYSIGHWLAIAATLVMLIGAFAWAMFKVPMMTSWLFGSVGSGAQGATDMFMRGAANALAAVIF